MSKHFFTEKEIKLLSTNPYVKSVSSKAITYSDEFKRIFIAEYQKGNFPRNIFEEHGFDIDIIGIKRVESSSKRWRKAYRKDGVLGLNDTRKGNSGRPSEKELSVNAKLARLEAQNNLLMAENELLKKIRFAEMGLKKNR